MRDQEGQEWQNRFVSALLSTLFADAYALYCSDHAAEEATDSSSAPSMRYMSARAFFTKLSEEMVQCMSGDRHGNDSMGDTTSMSSALSSAGSVAPPFTLEDLVSIAEENAMLLEAATADEEDRNIGWW